MNATEAIALGVSLVSLFGAIIAVSRTIFVSEARIQENKRRLDEQSGKLSAVDHVVIEQGRDLVGLNERIGNHNSLLSNKASVESVAALREGMDALRRDLGNQLSRIERKLDER